MNNKRSLIYQDAHLNLDYHPASDKTEELLKEAQLLVRNYESYYCLRKIRRSAKTEASFNNAIRAIYFGVLKQEMTLPEVPLCVTRSNRVLEKKSRYRHKVYTGKFREALDIMAAPEMDFITMQVARASPFEPLQTTVRAAGRVKDRLSRYNLTNGDLKLIPQAPELIILNTRREDYWDIATPLEYEDTFQTNKYRTEMEAINGWIASANLTLPKTLPDGRPYPFDSDDRQLVRIFSGSFDYCGRLFGGFWQSMGKIDRKDICFADGEKAVELDYGQAAIRILYGSVGIEPPNMTDLYAIKPFTTKSCDREGIKKVMNSMLFAKEPLKRFPKNTRGFFHKSISVQDVTKAIEVAHPDLRASFYSQIGYTIQHIESQVIVKVLLALKELGVVALPIHDALIVPESKAELATKVMLDCFKEKTGLEGRVTTI